MMTAIREGMTEGIAEVIDHVHKMIEMQGGLGRDGGKVFEDCVNVPFALD
jgi:hypothetical protein